MIPVGGSVVTIQLKEHANGTLLELRHDLPTAVERDHHVPGWRFQLALFANVVANEQYAGTTVMVDQWIRAWAETDATARTRLLTACTTDDVTMQDNYSCLRGREDLLDHIQMSQMFMPGVVMTRVGEGERRAGSWYSADSVGALVSTRATKGSG